MFAWIALSLKLLKSTELPLSISKDFPFKVKFWSSEPEDVIRLLKVKAVSAN